MRVYGLDCTKTFYCERVPQLPPHSAAVESTRSEDGLNLIPGNAAGTATLVGIRAATVAGLTHTDTLQ